MGGAVPPGLARLQLSKYQKIKDMVNVTRWGRDNIRKLWVLELYPLEVLKEWV